MTDVELTTTDVLADNTKNLCSFYYNQDVDDEDVDITPLNDNQYYTETEFIDFVDKSNFTNVNNLTILSINIANLLSKLNSLKSFLINLAAKGNKPDIIVIVETHISNLSNSSFDAKALKNIVPGYEFFHEGRKTKRGGGVGVLVSRDIQSESQICQTVRKEIDFIDEQFENLTIRIFLFEDFFSQY